MKKILKTRISRYLFVGVGASVLEMVVLFGFRDGLKFSPVKSVAISYWFGLIVAFLLQKYVTFQNHEKRIHMIGYQLMIYTALVLFNYGVSLLAVKLLSTHNSVFEIRTAVIAIGTLWNYVIYKNLLFPVKNIESNKDVKENN